MTDWSRDHRYLEYPVALISHPDPSIASSAAEYSESFGGAQALFTKYRPFICPFEPLVAAVPPQSRGLDIGCGNGLFLYLLWVHGRIGEGIGVDIAESETVAGNAALTTLGANRIRLEAVGSEAEWPTGKFDSVSMIDVMHHIPTATQRICFETACERVAKHGTLVYKDMCRTPAWRAWANRFHDLLKAKQWINYRAIDDIEVWARDMGLHLVDQRTINMYYYGHELRVFRKH